MRNTWVLFRCPMMVAFFVPSFVALISRQFLLGPPRPLKIPPLISCNWGQVCKRHDRIRDHLAAAARQAGMGAVTEQNMAIEPDVPGAVRGIHRADVTMIETDGRQLWVDVKVMTTKPKVGIKHALCQAEVAKCKQYGQGPPERSILHG